MAGHLVEDCGQDLVEDYRQDLVEDYRQDLWLRIKGC